MPKRAKTPEMFDDAKYLTVVGPYPPHPNMELAQHRMEFSRWIGACTGPEFLRAFYHKPTSPGSVIIEIDESFPDFKRLLGEHRWSEFLVEPRDEGRYVSKVFYCTYNTDRDVQKNGWKRVDVEDKWFKSRAASKFVSPYPATYYCDVPRERNVIHSPLCRPLPRSNFPPPPPEPSPVVGTPEWQKWKERQNTPNMPRVVTARTRGPPRTTGTASTGSAAGTPPAASRTSSSSSTRSDGAPQPIARSAWNNVNMPLSPPGLPVGIMSSSSSSGSSQRSNAGGSTWGEPPSQRSASPPETLSSPSSSSSDDVPPVTPSGGDPRQEAIVAEERLERAFAEFNLDDFDDDVYYSVNGGSVAGDAPPAEFDIRLMPRADAVFVPKESGNGSAPNAANDDDDFDDDETEDNPELCPEHNVVCSKGICLFHAARERERKREKRRQELEKERAERQARYEKNAKKKAKKALAEDPEDIASSGSSRTASPAPPAGPVRQRPPHLRPSAPVTPARAPPPHLKAGAPPPSPSSAKPMPPHLQRGPSSGGLVAPAPPTPTPSHAKSDGVQSEGSGWGNISEGPWAAAAPASKKNSRGNVTPAISAPAPKPAWSGWGKAPSISASSVQRNNESWSAPATSVAGDDHDDKDAALPKDKGKAKAKGKGKAKASPGVPRPEGAWGKAPSISASSVQRNNDSWSVSARSVSGGAQPKGGQDQRAWGNWGKAPSVSASSVARNHDSWSVGTRSVAGDDAPPAAPSDDGKWGRPPSVAAPSRPGRTWADEMDEEDEANALAAPAAEDDDVRSVAASTASGWGSISNGPW